MKAIVIISSTFLLACHLFFFWLLFYSDFNIPLQVFDPPVSLPGLALISTTLAVLIFFTKAARRKLPAASLWHLTLQGTLICFMAETGFQLIRVVFFLPLTWLQRGRYFSTGIIGVTTFSFVLAFFVSFQLKTRKTKLLLLFIAVFTGLVYLTKELVKSMIDG